MISVADRTATARALALALGLALEILEVLLRLPAHLLPFLEILLLPAHLLLLFLGNIGGEVPVDAHDASTFFVVVWVGQKPNQTKENKATTTSPTTTTTTISFVWFGFCPPDVAGEMGGCTPYFALNLPTTFTSTLVKCNAAWPTHPPTSTPPP